MRLSEKDRLIIKAVFADVFGEGRIMLFGSRLDDSKKGGDLDLFLDPEDTTDLYDKKRMFLVKLQRKIGDQKIDVVFSKPDENSLIQQIISKEAKEL